MNNLEQAIKELKSREMKFDETFSLVINTNVTNASIRGAVELPHKFKKYKVLSVTKEMDQEVMIDKIKALDFDRCTADNEGIAMIAKAGLSKLLGTKGLMPNKAVGTLHDDIKVANNIAENAILYRADKKGIIHIIAGKSSQDDSKLKENIHAIVDNVKEILPSQFKITSIYLDTTQGKSVKLEEILQ